MAYNPAGGQTYTLQSSISSTQTTITLSSFKVPVSEENITMALMNTDIAYATIAPRTSQSEFISFTTIVQNADGSATLTGVTRGLNKTYPFTEDTDFKLPHAGSSQFILSDAPQVFKQYSVIQNDESITGRKIFPQSGTASAALVGAVYAAPVQDTEIATKKYVDETAIAGAPDASTTTKGIGKTSVAPVSATNPIFVGDNDSRVPPIDTSSMTADQVAALDGTGTPNGTTGKYVTNDDTTGTGSVVRSSVLSYGEFGNGKDGALTFDGSTTILGIAPVANVYTLTKDIYGTTIVVNTGVTIIEAGYRIFATVSVTTNGTGAIRADGGNGGNASGITGGTAGAQAPTGTIFGGAAGTAGANGQTSSGTWNGTNGTAGTATTESIGASSAAGGNGGNSGAGQTGGTGGTSATATASTQGVYNVTFATIMREFKAANQVAYIQGGASGGSGASGAGSGSSVSSGSGGGGGAGGGILFISAKTIVNNGTFSAVGGNGGNGSASSGVNTGGGGGGGGAGGGSIVLIYNSYTNNGTVTVAGGSAGTGAAGAGAGTAGSNGSAGSSGNVIQITV